MPTEAFEMRLWENPSIKNQYDLRAVDDGHEIIADMFRKAGATGKWLVKPVKKVTWRGSGKFQARQILMERPGQRIIKVRTKPGDNGTAWDSECVGPANTDMGEMNRLFMRLSSVRWDEGTENTSPAELPSTRATPEVSQQAVMVPNTSGAEMAAFMGRIGAITKRVADRDSNIQKLRKQKETLEGEIEKKMGELQDVDTLIKQLNDEDSADEEGQRAKAFIAAFKDFQVSK